MALSVDYTYPLRYRDVLLYKKRAGVRTTLVASVTKHILQNISRPQSDVLCSFDIKRSVSLRKLSSFEVLIPIRLGNKPSIYFHKIVDGFVKIAVDGHVFNDWSPALENEVDYSKFMSSTIACSILLSTMKTGLDQMLCNNKLPADLRKLGVTDIRFSLSDKGFYIKQDNESILVRFTPCIDIPMEAKTWFKSSSQKGEPIIVKPKFCKFPLVDPDLAWRICFGVTPESELRESTCPGVLNAYYYLQITRETEKLSSCLSREVIVHGLLKASKHGLQCVVCPDKTQCMYQNLAEFIRSIRTALQTGMYPHIYIPSLNLLFGISSFTALDMKFCLSKHLSAITSL